MAKRVKMIKAKTAAEAKRIALRRVRRDFRGMTCQKVRAGLYRVTFT